MKKLLLVLTISSFSLVASCMQTTVKSTLPPSGVSRTVRSWHLINGLTSSEVNAAECTNGISSVTTKVSFIDIIISSFTFALITPNTVTYHCAAGNSTKQNPSVVVVQPSSAPSSAPTPAPAPAPAPAPNDSL